MKRWSLRTLHTLTYLLLVFACQASMAEGLPGIVMVEIAGLKGATGNVYISVYDSDSTWLSDEVVMSKKVVIADSLDGDLVRAELQLPMGEYALSAYHDEDDDEELDTNFIGIPKEPVALSNNAVPNFGPPDYEDAAFVLGAQPVVQSIIMREP